MENREIPALDKLSSNLIVAQPIIYYSCPDCGKQMECEYNFDDSKTYLICSECKKVFTLILKEVDKKLRKE